MMNKQFVKIYFSTIFLIVIFMGSFHHHDDLKQHNSCQICLIQSNIISADIPSDISYLPTIKQISELIVPNLTNFYHYIQISSLHSRAPPILLS